MRHIAIALLLVLQGCAVLGPPDDWTRTDTVAEIAWQVMNVVDYRQTIDIQNHPNLIEANVISQAFLGERPNTSDTAKLMAAYGIGHYLISKFLPARWRSLWHVGMLYGKGRTLMINHRNGLRIDEHGHDQ